MDDEELRNPDSWDLESAERVKGRKGGRTHLTVAFSKDDFQAIASAAQAKGLKTITFVREAALRQVYQSKGITWSDNMRMVTLRVSNGNSG